MATTLPDTLGATVMADLLGVTPRTLQRWVKDGAQIKGRRSGHYVVKATIQHAIGAEARSEAARLKAESEQKRRDLDNELREERLRRDRELVMDRSIMEISKQEYVAGIVKRHVAWRPRMKRQFPDIDKEILDYCDEELDAIRESCKTFNIDESEDNDE